MLINNEAKHDRVQAQGRRAADIPVRRVAFRDPLRGLTRHFATDESIVVSHLVVHLSSVFPAGEDFFVRSVRAYRNHIDDPELKQQVKHFIGQEAVHGREHRELNEQFDKLGYSTATTDRWTDRMLRLRTWMGPDIVNLGITAAIEHFTAVLGEVLLTGQFESLGHDGIKSILLWHALEECEHKAVAFDVFRHVGGSERVRVRTMNVVTVLFIGRIAQLMVFSLLRDRAAYKRGRLRRDFKAAMEEPLFSRKTWKTLRDYNRTGFHPNDNDTDSVIDQWRDELFGETGTLTKYVANAVGRRD